jgi:carbon storage regulator
MNKESSMLVLSRKVGERIHVGDNITIEIRRIAGNRVTIALAAPREVRILRGELERAAREFREPSGDKERPAADCKPCVPVPNAGRVTIFNGLPTSTVGRDFAI